jgi:hypothetical protein
MASTTSRDRSRLAVAAVSGVTTIAALSATGWLAGTAARSTAADQAAPTTPKPTVRAAKARHVRATPKVVLRQRPQRTHVSVRYVQGAPSAPVGSGGTVSQPVTHTPAAPAPAPQHSAPAPAPAPPPAPSSGS